MLHVPYKARRLHNCARPVCRILTAKAYYSCCCCYLLSLWSRTSSHSGAFARGMCSFFVFFHESSFLPEAQQSIADHCVCCTRFVRRMHKCVPIAAAAHPTRDSIDPISSVSYCCYQYRACCLADECVGNTRLLAEQSIYGYGSTTICTCACCSHISMYSRASHRQARV